MIYLSAQTQEFFYNINKNTINAILSQGQVLAVVLITLIPIKKGPLVAFLLCSISTFFALLKVISSKTFYALPGVIIPIISIIISITINSLKQKLYKRKMNLYWPTSF